VLTSDVLSAIYINEMRVLLSSYPVRISTENPAVWMKASRDFPQTFCANVVIVIAHSDLKLSVVLVKT
jgi:hypothetical protein